MAYYLKLYSSIAFFNTYLLCIEDIKIGFPALKTQINFQYNAVMIQQCTRCPGDRSRSTSVSLEESESPSGETGDNPV